MVEIKDQPLKPGDAGYVEPGKGDVEKIKVGDKEYTADEVKQMAEDMENDRDWKASNTQRAQETADLRRQLEPYIELDRVLRANPDKAAKIKAILNPKQAEEISKLDPEDVPARMLEIVDEKIGKIEKKISNIEEKGEVEKAASDLSKELDAMQDKYPKMDREKVINVLSRGTDDSVEKVCRQNHQTQDKHDEEVIKNYLDKKKGKPAVMGRGGAIPNIGKVDQSKLRFDDGSAQKAVKDALAAIKEADEES